MFITPGTLAIFRYLCTTAEGISYLRGRLKPAEDGGNDALLLLSLLLNFQNRLMKLILVVLL